MLKKGLVFAGMIAVAGMVMTGCSSVNTNDAAGSSRVAMVPAVYEPVIKHTNQKVEGNAKVSVLFGIFSWGVSAYADRTNVEPTTLFGATNVVKQGAVYNACKNAKCDLLLNSKYEITTMDYFVFKTMECKVSGFPGVEVDVVKKDIPAVKEAVAEVKVAPKPLF